MTTALLGGAQDRQPGLNEAYGDGPAVVTTRDQETQRTFDVLGPRTLEIAEEYKRSQFRYDMRTARDYDQLMENIGVFVERHDKLWPNFVDVLAPITTPEHFGGILDYWEAIPHALRRTEELVAPHILSHKTGKAIITTSDFSIGVEFTNQSLFTEMGRFTAVEMVRQIPLAEERTRGYLLISHIMQEPSYRKQLFDLEGVKTYDSIAEALGDRKWIGLLNSNLGLHKYLASMQSAGHVYQHIIVAAGSIIRTVFGSANVKSETAYFMRGSDYLSALRDPKAHLEKQLPNKPVIWEFNIGEVVSDVSSMRLNPLAHVLTFGDWFGIFGSERYSTVAPDPARGFDNNHILAVQAIDARADDWHTFSLLNVLRNTGRRDFDNNGGRFTDLASRDSFSAPNGFGQFLIRQLMKFAGTNDLAQFGDPYHWIVRSGDGMLNQDGLPHPASEFLPMPCKFWGDVDYPFRSLDFDISHAKQAASVFKGRISDNIMPAIRAGYVLADELSTSTSKSGNDFSAVHLDLMQALFATRDINSSAAVAGTPANQTPWSEGKMHGFGSELGLYFLAKDFASDNLRAAFLARVSADPTNPANSSALAEFDRERTIARDAWEAKLRFFNLARLYYPGSAYFVQNNQLPWLNAEFVTDLSHRDVMQFSALFLDDHARYPSYFTPVVAGATTRATQALEDILQVATGPLKVRYALVLALGGIPDGSEFIPATAVAEATSLLNSKRSPTTEFGETAIALSSPSHLNHRFFTSPELAELDFSTGLTGAIATIANRIHTPVFSKEDVTEFFARKLHRKPGAPAQLAVPGRPAGPAGLATLPINALEASPPAITAANASDEIERLLRGLVFVSTLAYAIQKDIASELKNPANLTLAGMHISHIKHAYAHAHFKHTHIHMHAHIKHTHNLISKGLEKKFLSDQTRAGNLPAPLKRKERPEGLERVAVADEAPVPGMLRTPLSFSLNWWKRDLARISGALQGAGSSAERRRVLVGSPLRMADLRNPAISSAFPSGNAAASGDPERTRERSGLMELEDTYMSELHARGRLGDPSTPQAAKRRKSHTEHMRTRPPDVGFAGEAMQFDS